MVFFGVSGPVAGVGDSNVSFLVELARKTVLVDCSGNPAGVLAAAGCDLCDLDFLVLTHAHTDHLYGLPSLVHAAWQSGRRKPLRIIANAATREQAERLLGVFGLPGKSGMFSCTWVTREEGAIQVSHAPAGERASMRWFPVRHGVPCIGLAFREPGQVVVYSGDTAPSPRVQEEARGCAMLIHDCSGAAADEKELSAKGHTSAAAAAVLARGASAGSLALVHLPPGGREALLQEAAAGFDGPVAIPPPGRWLHPGRPLEP